MANKNPSPATRFSADKQPEKRGRSRESRDRVTGKFLYELAEHFEKHGAQAIEDLYQSDKRAYVSTVAALVPRELEVTNNAQAMSDDKLAQAIEILTDALREQAPPAMAPKPKTVTVN